MFPTLKPGAKLSWWWSDDPDPGIGGTEFTIKIKDGQIEWKYSEDRWGRSGTQSFADYAQFGPLWNVNADILAELAEQFGLSGLPWQKPGYQDYSPVWWAVEQSKHDEAFLLLVPADAARRYHGQRTLLMHAVEKNSPRVVERLLDLGADPNARDERGCTALMEASHQLPPPVELFRMLLDHGADINAAAADGRTPLIIFCSSMNPNLEVLEMLIARGAQVNARDGEGKSALDRLAQRPYLAPELSAVLRKSGAH